MHFEHIYYEYANQKDDFNDQKVYENAAPYRDHSASSPNLVSASEGL